MSRKTPATVVIERAGVAYEALSYEYDPDAAQIGLHAAESLGVSPEIVLKTLMTVVDGRPVCVVLASDREVSMKRLAAAAGGKAAQMMKPADAERLTGYRVGGISPFGQRKAVPVFLDESALSHDRVYVNGGQRGLQLRLAPRTIIDILGARTAALS